MDRLETGLRSQKKLSARREIRDHALKLFLEHGFDAVSVDQIVEPLTVSKRTFFRYFATKEEVVFDWYDDLKNELSATLAAMPVKSDPYEALCKTFSSLVRYHDENPRWAFAMATLSHSVPSLLAKGFEKRIAWEEALSSTLLERLPKSAHRELQTRVIVGSASNAFFSATEQWFQERGKSNIKLLLKKAFEFAAPRISI